MSVESCQLLTTALKIPPEKVSNNSSELPLLDRQYIASYWWSLIAMYLYCTISEIIPAHLLWTRLPVVSATLIWELKLQAISTFQFMYKHTAINIFPKVWELELGRFQTAIVLCHSTDHIQFSLSYLLYYVAILYRFWNMISYFPKCKDVMRPCTSTYQHQ